jgi:hypothetical protein
MEYSLTAGTDVITFSLPQQPVPLASGCAFYGGCFSLAPVALVVDGNPIADGEVNFYLSDVAGGITIFDGSTLLVNNDGDPWQLFTGTLSSPTLGAFSNLALTDNGYGSPLYSESFFLTATVVDAGVPEPSSAILWTLGGLALAALAAHRRKSIHTA